MDDNDPADATSAGGKRGPAILLALTAVAVVVIGARASLVSSSASEAWQEAVRQQVKQAAAYVEDIRYVYDDEVPRAVRIMEARFRAQELTASTEGLSGPSEEAVFMEQLLQSGLAKDLESVSKLTSDPRYTTDFGFDTARRLSDIRSENPELVSVDPDRRQAQGDLASRHAVRLVGATTVIAVAFLVGSLAQAFQPYRRPLLRVGSSFLLVGMGLAILTEVGG